MSNPTASSHTAQGLSRLLLPLLLGIAITLVLRGYQFGGGNHTVYLIEPLREVHPELLANDWWTTHTLQYHVAFNKLTATLMRAGIVEPAFLILYLSLVVLLHVAWIRLSLILGLDARGYLLSVLLYYLSAGGTGLGSYQFLQDSSFLPGNVANVALLWGIGFWIEGRIGPAAAAMAVASLFHLNHALIALAFWPTGFIFHRWHGRPAREENTTPTASITRAILWFGLILLFALPSILPAARLALAHVPKMPLRDFVNLYVHLRHPHHYDPLSWPAALWISFLWPIPLAIIAYRRRTIAAPVRAAFAFTFFLALQLIALLFAGVIFVSEPLIQMSLFRSSIYAKLLSCIGAAAFLLDPGIMARQNVRRALIALPLAAILGLVAIRFARPSSTAAAFVGANLGPLLLFIAIMVAGVTYICFRQDVPKPRADHRVAAGLILLFALFRNYLGLQIAIAHDGGRAYLEVCHWARDHTPIDALFIVPPNEQLFRYHAQRAIVVNFKNVPQLSSEMAEWQKRLEAVLDQPLTNLPKRFDLAHAAIAARYDALRTEHLTAVARQYGARYVITARPLPTLHAAFEKDAYHLYDLDTKEPKLETH
ncbi:MAG: uncharacterized protein JWN40_203 [Phycisphaerales bacterium]|nr:uncharacterized protein [Phycisphaerales bacterium]